MVKKIMSSLLAVLCTGVLSCGIVSAQTTQKHLNSASGFDSVVASGDFDLTFRYNEKCSVDWTVDEALADYVEVYVRGSSLNFAYNSKNLPKEIKNLYKGKNARKAVFRAIIYGPSLSSITLTDNTSLDASGATITTESFGLDLSANAKVNNLSVSAQRATVTMSKNSTAVLDFGADEISLNLKEKAVVNLKHDSDRMDIIADGNSSVKAQGDTKDAVVTLTKNAKATILGNAETLTTNTSNNSEFDGVAFRVNSASVVANNSDVYVNAADSLALDIKSGAKIYFMENPSVKIVGVTSSTILPFSGVK